jgi:hypothetical protein
MKSPRSIFVLAASLAFCAVTLGTGEAAIADSDTLSSDTRKELAQAKRATAKYHNIANAINDGYIDADFLLIGVGCHMINLDLAFGDNGEIDLTKPELLIYATEDCAEGADGQSELRSIEYLRPCNGICDESNLPEGFSGDDDVWEVFGDNLFWTLHAWVWRHNPDGVFVKINPRIED